MQRKLTYTHHGPAQPAGDGLEAHSNSPGGATARKLENKVRMCAVAFAGVDAADGAKVACVRSLRRRMGRCSAAMVKGCRPARSARCPCLARPPACSGQSRRHLRSSAARQCLRLRPGLYRQPLSSIRVRRWRAPTAAQTAWMP